MSGRSNVPSVEARGKVVRVRGNSLGLCRARYSWCLHVLRGQPWKRREVVSNVFRQHLRMLAISLVGEKFAEVRSAAMVLFPVVEHRTSWFEQVHPRDLGLVPVLLRVSARRELWKREPIDWEPSAESEPKTGVQELIRFVFGDAEVPSFLWEEWWRPVALDSEALNAFCKIAAGESHIALRQVAPKLTRKAAHLAISDVSGDRASTVLRRSQVRAMGGDECLVDVVCSSFMEGDFRRDVVYLPLLMMLIRAGAEVSIEVCGMVIDYVSLQLRETVGIFRLEGRSVRSLELSARRFFEAMQESAEFLGEPVEGEIEDAVIRRRLLSSRGRALPEMGIRDYEAQSDPAMGGERWHYSIRQVRALGELTSEGEDMRHCVASYASLCQSGKAVIFSLRSRRAGDAEMEREVTIDVDPRSNRVVSVKAWRNKRPVDKTREIVRRWATANALELNEACFR